MVTSGWAARPGRRRLTHPCLRPARMQRRHDIDALRVIAFSLLILYHSAMV